MTIPKSTKDRENEKFTESPFGEVAVKTINNPKLIQLDYDGGTSLIYLGLAKAGSTTASASWHIKKFTYTGGKATAIEMADGDENYDNVWDNRAALSYS